MLIRTFFKHLGIFLTILVVWEFSVANGYVNEFMLPRPSDIAESFVRLYVTQGNIWQHLYATVLLVLVGFVTGSLVGIGLAVIVGSSKVIRAYMQPYIVLIEATPRIAIAPLMLAWFGFGWEPKIAIITLICFFSPFVNTLTSILNVDQDLEEMFRSLKASKSQMIWKLILPSAIPEIMSGLRLAMASALGGALIAEFVSANEGMGLLLSRYAAAYNMPSAFASLLSLTIVGFALYRMMELISHRIVYWEDDARARAVSKKRSVSWRAPLAAVVRHKADRAEPRT